MANKLERYKEAEGKFCHVRYISCTENKEIIILKYGILDKIYPDGILRLRHKSTSDFWDIPADKIIEFSCESMKVE